MAGKGSKQRPTNLGRYVKNHDDIKWPKKTVSVVKKVKRVKHKIRYTY